MAVSTKVTGKTTKWKDMVSLPGQTVVSMKVNTSMTKRRAMACFTGLMDVNTTDSGRMANNMVSAFTPLHRVRRKKANGRKENVAPGSSEQKFNHHLQVVLV